MNPSADFTTVDTRQVCLRELDPTFDISLQGRAATVLHVYSVSNNLFYVTVFYERP